MTNKQTNKRKPIFIESVKNAIAIAMKNMSSLFLPSQLLPWDLFLVSHVQIFSPTVFWGLLALESLQRHLLSSLSVPLSSPSLRKMRDVKSHSWIYFIPMMQPEASAPRSWCPWGWQQTPSRSQLFAERIHQKIIVLGKVASLSLCWKYKPRNPLLHPRGVLCLVKQTFMWL